MEISNVIIFIVIFLSLFINIYFICNEINKKEKFFDFIVIFIFILILMCPLILFYFDSFNIPSLMKLDRNVDKKIWLEILGNYITGIVSAIIGALVAVWVAMFQIKKNNKDNINSMRIQNMPIIKYELNTNKNEENEITFNDVIDTNFETKPSTIYELDINLTNIGLNSIKKNKNRIFITNF